MSEVLTPPRPVPDTPQLLALSRLDGLLAQAVEVLTDRWAAQSAADTLPGLHISAAEARHLLRLPPGRPLLDGSPEGPGERPGWDDITAGHGGWSWLRTRHGLTDLELDLTLMALAPEVDLRYERIYGYLQDDMSRRRPLVGLALDLLSRTAGERLAARAVLASDASLLRHRVLDLVPDPLCVAPPLLAHFLVLDEQITDVLLGQSGLDRRLAGCCRLEVPEGDPALGTDPARLAEWAGARGPLRIHVKGPAGSTRGRPARDLALGLGLALLTLEPGGLPDDPDSAADILTVAFREASLLGALLRVDGIEHLRRPDDDRGTRERILGDLLAEHDGHVVVEGETDWTPPAQHPLGFVPVPVPRCDLSTRQLLWERELAAHGVGVAPADLHDLAARFRLGPDRIADAALTAVGEAGRRAARVTDRVPGTPTGLPCAPTRDELFAAARAQSSHRLTGPAQRVRTVHGWDDIVLPPDCAAQLTEVCARVAHSGQVMDDWGFARTLSHGRGVSALFTGPPGTGKTMAAEVIAHELGLELARIDLAGVVSKYIGETEKNLDRVFTAAADTDAVLLFDEADALFGKRSEVREAHDRYANIEVAHLLQRMEQYEGLVVLTSNLRRNLDEAFTRRLQFIVEFPFPGRVDRERIWRVCLPSGAPRDAALDFGRLARDFPLTGGSIRNVVLHAAYLAASANTAIGMPHLLRATRREYQKLDQVMPGAGPDGDERG
ncbi:ATP-binding protein [Streptomyces massasporeus]|uniref:AAA family ATPase n=1 Tax=Streptomyces massasporeus TaxID=67324 RepID=UPI0036EAD270